MRMVGGVLAGVVVAMLTITLAEMVNGFVFPVPPVDWNDPDAVGRLVALMPAEARWMIVAGWFAGALLGAALAVTITRRAWAGLVPAGAVLIGGLANALLIDHPGWMDAGAVLAPLAGGGLGILLARPRGGRAVDRR